MIILSGRFHCLLFMNTHRIKNKEYPHKGNNTLLPGDVFLAMILSLSRLVWRSHQKETLPKIPDQNSWSLNLWKCVTKLLDECLEHNVLAPSGFSFFPELCLDLVNTNGEIMNQQGKEKSQPLNGSRKNKRKRFFGKVWTILGDAQKWFASELKSSNVSWLQCVLKYINLFHLENAERIIAFCAPPLASQCSSSLQFSYDQSLILWEWVHSKKSQDEELLSEILRKTDEGLCWDESWVNNGIKDKQLSIYFVHNPSFYLAEQIMTAITEQITRWEETMLREYVPVSSKKWEIPLRQLGPGHLSHKPISHRTEGLSRLRGQETETSLNSSLLRPLQTKSHS